MIEGLKARLYPRERWGLVPQVRSAADAPYDVLRRADAIGIDFYPSGGGWLRFHGFEVKLTRGDWLRELKDPTKIAPFALFCSAWCLVVPAPWKDVVLSLSELPAMWGLIEVGTGGAVVVVEPQEREAEPPTRGFVRALLRAASLQAERVAQVEEIGGAPMTAIVAVLDRQHVELACGHRTVRPLDKIMPPRVPCFACAEEAEAAPERPGPAFTRPAAEPAERKVA